MENPRHAAACSCTIRKLTCGVGSTDPIAAAPMQLGSAKMTNDHGPRSRSRMTGSHMPMHQVHEAPR